MTVKLTHTNERTIRSILQTYRSELPNSVNARMKLMTVHNCDVMIREDVSYAIMTLLIIDYRR